MERMKREVKKAIESALNIALQPVADSYRFLKGVVRKTKKSMPYVYDEVEGIIKQHVISLERDKKLMHAPDINSVGGLITNSIISKIPNIDRNELAGMVSKKASKSFLDLLAKGSSAEEEEKDYTSMKRKKMFKSILITNRGEIALRVIRSCKELGISSIVIYSDNDKNSLAVKFADKAYSIGKAKGYLDMKKILKIAKKAKAEAIHPGYGFLSENREFAELCHKKKITFIGPSIKAIDAVGQKVNARNIAIKNNIPVLMGSEESLKSKEEALDMAEKITYPVILKASAGGGGKGVRVVRAREKLEKAYDSVQAEAEASFGDPSLYIEKYIEEPRHIEFQILADKYGNTIYLGERECSIQRRHQKLIEESPSPALDQELREKMGNAAVKLAKSVDYVGAGTVEFLLDKKKNFYFMEMNTRIQVEHGITEMVTNVDLIKEQIKIAAGAKLVVRQPNVKIEGWAIECRVNAENPFEKFCPATGTITTYLQPGGPGIRVCSSCHAGHVISPHYDSMIAKLMCKGRTRDEAIAGMKRALAEFIIEGVDTTIPFHLAVLNNEEFAKGNLSTFFIKKNKVMEQLKAAVKPRKKELPKQEKILLVSTAVSEYVGRKKGFEDSAWSRASRKETLET